MSATSDDTSQGTAILLTFESIGIDADVAAKLIKQCLKSTCPKLAAALSSTNSEKFDLAYGGPVLYFP